MSERQGFAIRNGFLAGGALVILVLLVLFYSTVSGAVDRAARRHADASAQLAAHPGLSPQSRRLASLDPSGS